MLPKWVPWLGERIQMHGQTVSKFNVQATSTCVVCVACICLSLYAYMISTKCVSKDAHVHSC